MSRVPGRFQLFIFIFGPGAFSLDHLLDRVLVVRLAGLLRPSFRVFFGLAAQLLAPLCDALTNFLGARQRPVRLIVIANGGSFAVTHGAQAGIGTLPIVYFGTDQQKLKAVILAACTPAVPTITLSNVSKKGTYFSLNAVLQVEDEEMRVRIFDYLNSSPDVKIVI